MSSDAFCVDEVRSRLRESKTGFFLSYQETVGSTNDEAKEAAAAGAPDGSVFLAGTQTKGRGRRGHTWLSEPGTSLSMSLLLRPRLPLVQLVRLVPVTGLAVARAIRDLTGIPAQIKWPNDVAADGKKLCGILMEAGENGSYAVVGIGINVSGTQFPPELADKAASLALLAGKTFTREEVAAAVLAAFARYYGMFRETGDLSRLRGEYEALLANLGRRVRILDAGGGFTGIARGIGAGGELLVQRDGEETVTPVYAGEVSVRGMYGYV